jgi:hypothetical protein
MRNIVLAFTALLVFSCGTVKLSVPDETVLARASNIYPGITLDELNQGLADYKQYCSPCHKVKDPNSKTIAQWEKIVPGMSAKAAKSESVPDIDPATQASILQYLSAVTTNQGS